MIKDHLSLRRFLMPANSRENQIPLQRAIDKYFEVSLYLLVLTGFGMLASTGGVDFPSLVVVGIALALAGYLLATGRRFVLSERWTTPLSIAYFAFFALDYLALSRNFLLATVHLVVFSVVVRMFTLRRERDYVTLAILAFLMVLASAVLTVDSLFLFSFAVFMLIAIGTFVLMEMRRSARSANVLARHSSDPDEHRHLAFALARVGPVLMLLILLGGFVLFFIMPRRSGGYLGGYSFGTDFSSGFSDHVQLGRIGEIQRSNSVVMHVRIDGDTIGRYDLHWRGVSLAEFDGHTWSNNHEPHDLPKQPDGSFAVADSDGSAASPPSSSDGGGNLIRYHVLMEPIGINVFFLAPWPRRVSGDYRMLATDIGGAVYGRDPQHPISRYEATSNIATPLAEDLRRAGTNYPAPIRDLYLRWRELDLDPRVPKLAAEITASGSNDYDKAAALEHYLQTHFGYTLELPQTAEKDPIANFLFQRKRGHCEYFASSMAVMLRTVGIPSRVVTGFRSDEFNDLTGSYVVRAKDAHAWVEAYFPGYGWQTFDPTPAGNGIGTPQGWGRLVLYVDAMASFWRDWIVSYDTSHQYVLGQAAMVGSRNLWEGARTWARKKYASMLKWARRSQNRVEHSPTRWAMIGASIALALLLLANLSRMARWLHEKRLAAHPERSPQQAASMWYERMARVMARRGVRKSENQTAQEFLKRIEDAKLREPAGRFVDAYESARFGNSGAAAQRLPDLYEEVELATRDR